MDKRSLKRHMNDQNGHEINIISPQRNANQNYKEMRCHTQQNGYNKKGKITSVGEDVEKLESFIYCW
jgi:hypothetical protein